MKMQANHDTSALPPAWASDGYLLLDAEVDGVRRVEEALDPSVVTAETKRANADLEMLCQSLPAAHTVPPEVMRKARREGKGVLPVFGPLAEGRWLDFTGTSGRPGALRVLAPEAAAKGVFLHIHGGGWTFGAPDEYDAKNLELAREAGIVVVSVRYRLAPEHPWPAALDDCLDAHIWLIDHAKEEFGTERIAIGGDSAGAHLAAATLLRSKEEGFPAVDAAVFTYGCFDLRMTPSMASWGDRQLVLSTPVVKWFVGNLVPSGPLDDPQLSPMLADLRGMPPALFVVGTEDPLLDDSRLMWERWSILGSPAKLALFPGGAHAFDLQDIPIARAYASLRAGYLAEILGYS